MYEKNIDLSMFDEIKEKDMVRTDDRSNQYISEYIYKGYRLAILDYCDCTAGVVWLRDEGNIRIGYIDYTNRYMVGREHLSNDIILGDKQYIERDNDWYCQ